VSRLLSRFHRDGLLVVRQRDVEILDAAALRAMVGHW